MEFENLVNGHRIWNARNVGNYKRFKNKIAEIIALSEQEIDLNK